MSDQTPPPPSSNTNPNTTSNNSNNQNSSNDNANQNNTSLPSRIQSSASNLARNAFFNATPPADIASALPGGSKAGPASSTGTGAGTAHYHTEASTHPGSSSSARGVAGEGGTAESFRSGSGQSASQRDDEEAFQHGSQGFEGDVQQLQGDLGIENPYAEQDKGKGKAKATELEPEEAPSFDDIWQTTTTATSIPQTQLPHPQQHPQPQLQQHQDGAEVITLLSSPSFNPDFPPSLDELNHHPDTTLIPTDLSDQPQQLHPQDETLSQTEKQILDSFRRQDPDPLSHTNHRQRNLNPTSLVPDIGAFLDTTQPQTGTGDANASATSLRDAVLTGLPGAEDWVAVEEMYQDEVWGYLKPALQAAAKEMEEQSQGQGGSTGEDGPAVARLKMILRHMGA